MIRENYMAESIPARKSKEGSLRQYVDEHFMTLHERIWKRLPVSLRKTRPIRAYGNFIHSRVQMRAPRTQYHGTFFFRNRPELELIRTLSNQKAPGSELSIAVLGCSNGAEVYSILYTIRSARPDLKLKVHALDISEEILEIAKNGLYALKIPKLMDAQIFQRSTEDEMRAMFDLGEMDQVRIKPWIKEGIDWEVADAGDPELAIRLGHQDLVIANQFLCHMAPPDAERCLRSISKLVNPGGYLFVSGIDMNIRTKVALELRWKPVRELLEEIHDGDPSVRGDWPLKYWGLEPFDSKRENWMVRYASVFQLGPKA
jgi:chemotaxis methyl-accepting protein methylase